MNGRPKFLHVGGVLYWTIRTRNPDTMVLKDADSTPTVAVRKNGASTGDSVTVTKRSATTGIYDCSYNPAGEVEGDEFTIEETATVTGTTTGSATYSNSWEFSVIAVERGTDGANTTAPDNAGISAINAKTANLPSDPADASDIAAAFSAVNAALAAIAGYIDTEITDIRNRLPAALVGGKMDSSVGAYQTGQAPLQPITAGRKANISASGGIAVTGDEFGNSLALPALAQQNTLESVKLDTEAIIASQATKPNLSEIEASNVLAKKTDVQNIPKYGDSQRWDNGTNQINNTITKNP